MEGINEERWSRFETLVREQAPHLGWRAIQAQVNVLIAQPENKLALTWQQSLSHIRQATGVYCFAGGGKSTLMWSHYGSEHTGVCLQFERIRDLNVLAHAVPVDYLPDLPILNFLNDFHGGIGKMLFTKYPCWEYEQESRIAIPEQARSYLPFAPVALRKLIFGCRAKAGFIDDVTALLSERAAVGYPAIDVFYTRQHGRKYRLVVSRDRKN